jgi:hypothetical protein
LTRLSVHDPPETRERQVCSSIRSQFPQSPKYFDIQRQSTAPLQSHFKVEVEQPPPPAVVPPAIEIRKDIQGPMVQKRRKENQFIRWYERRMDEHLEQPPANDAFKGVKEGYYFLNWVDDATCQAWVSINGVEGNVSWEEIKWGDMRPGSQDRFVVTEKGFPSFVAKSTWLKTYKGQKSRIVAT